MQDLSEMAVGMRLAVGEVVRLALWPQAAMLWALLVLPPSPPPGEGASGEAQRAFSGGEYARAAGLLKAAIEKDPRDAALRHWLGRCQYELRQYDEAARSAEGAVAIDPGRSEYHLWLGRALGGRAERAGWLSAFGLARRVGTEFEQAVRLDPHNVRAQRDLIEFYGRAPGIVGGGQAKAWRQAEALAGIDPLEARLARAELWRDQAKLDRAEAEYRLVLEGHPARPGPCLEAADFYEQRRDGARMSEAVEAAAAADRADPQLAYYEGVAAFLLGGRDADAERLLAMYLDTVPLRSDHPAPAAAREWLGRLYERRGQAAAAAREYQSALALDPDRKGAREALRRLSRQ
jgi:tetratricopeptide (TPR) repeat protein